MAAPYPGWHMDARAISVQRNGGRWIRPDPRINLKRRPDLRSRTPQHGEIDSTAPDDGTLAADIKAIRELMYEFAKLRFEVKWRRIKRDFLDGKYSPNQPRVPAGNPDGGQWTNGGGSNGEPPARLAGDLPPWLPPNIPKQRPPTVQERNRIGRGIARWGGPIGALLQAIPWLEENAVRVDAYRDPPKSLEELQEGASVPKRGYDIHHIVEQSPAEQDGFPRSQIDASENLVRISTYKHWDINSWYQTKADEYGGLSPREYLVGKSWEERTQVGLKALIKFGVLKP